MLKVFLENVIRDAVIITIDSNGGLRWFKQVPWQPLFRRKDNFSIFPFHLKILAHIAISLYAPPFWKKQEKLQFYTPLQFFTHLKSPGAVT